MNPESLDALTGLGNLRAARSLLENLIESEQQFALLYCDVDLFKWVNEMLGHYRGDEELCRIARDLERICWPFPVFRTSGDEFLIVLPEHSSEQAREVAEQILASQRPFAVFIEGYGESLTFSIGFALFPDHALDAEKLLQAADVALWKAKSGGRLSDGTPYVGRNRVMTWGDFLDEFPDQSARFLNAAFVNSSV